MDQKLNRTLRQIEKLLLWAQTGRRPTSSDPALEFIHEGLLYHYAPHNTDGKPVRSRLLTETEWLRLISGAMRELSDMNLPEEVDLSSVASTVETFKNSFFVKILSSYDSVKELREAIPYCFACFRRAPLQYAHIISRGASVSAKDEVDNSLLLCNTCHIELQHQHGWEELLKEYPHLIPRVERAIDLFAGGTND